MTQEKIDRINALARKSRTPEGLTEAEKTEQQALRLEYKEAVLNSLRQELAHTSVQEPDGTLHRLTPKTKHPLS